MTEDAAVVEEESVDETEARAELSAEQKRARRRGLAQQAIALAIQGRWDEALVVNGQILVMFPDDPEANNRIGNALRELNRISEAIEAYERTVKVQPTNTIAQRNLDRLRRIADAGEARTKPSQKLPPAFFVEEVGKTGLTSLTEIAGPDTTVHVSAGDEVGLREAKGALEVTLLDGTYLGKTEQNLADRLIRLMKGGNQYQAGVVMAEPARIRILVRETVQSPEQKGRISFPPKTAAVRAYTRDSLVRRSGEDEDDLEGETSDAEVEDGEDEDENPAEFGFSETSSLSGDADIT